MQEKLELFAHILNSKNTLNNLILKTGQNIIETINEAKRFERQYQDDKKRTEFRYNQIMKEKNE